MLHKFSALILALILSQVLGAASAQDRRPSVDEELTSRFYWVPAVIRRR